jgi:hypothetical protein
MAPGARRRARDDPSILCFLTPLQGFTLTRELQPNGLHPPEIDGGCDPGGIRAGGSPLGEELLVLVISVGRG